MTEFLSDTCFTRQHRVRNARYNSCDDVRFALDHYAWIVFVLATVHGHKYSSPSIFYYIFHIKPHLFQKNILRPSLGRFLWNLFQDTQNFLNFMCLFDSNFCLHGVCFLVLIFPILFFFKCLATSENKNCL